MKCIQQILKENLFLLEDLLDFKKQDLQAYDTCIKNIYFDVSDDIVNKCNNTVHRTIGMTTIDVTSDSYAEYSEDSIKKILN